jgi:hypothetical protein
LVCHQVNYWATWYRPSANPKKVEAIENLQPPRTRKEIQKLAGMMVALS